MNRYLLILILLIGSTLLSLAQEPTNPPEEPEEVLIEDMGRLPESFEMASTRSTTGGIGNITISPSTSDKTKAHVLSTNSTEEGYTLWRVPYRSHIIPWCEAIELYVNKRSRLLNLMLTKATYYFPIIEVALDKYGMPLELKYLAIVEVASIPPL